MKTTTQTKAYLATKATLAGKSEQELAGMLRAFADKAAAAPNERAAAKHWHGYFAVEDTLKGWAR